MSETLPPSEYNKLKGLVLKSAYYNYKEFYFFCKRNNLMDDLSSQAILNLYERKGSDLKVDNLTFLDIKWAVGDAKRSSFFIKRYNYESLGLR